MRWRHCGRGASVARLHNSHHVRRRESLSPHVAQSANHIADLVMEEALGFHLHEHQRVAVAEPVFVITGGWEHEVAAAGARLDFPDPDEVDLPELRGQERGRDVTYRRRVGSAVLFGVHGGGLVWLGSARGSAPLGRCAGAQG